MVMKNDDAGMYNQWLMGGKKTNWKHDAQPVSALFAFRGERCICLLAVNKSCQYPDNLRESETDLSFKKYWLFASTYLCTCSVSEWCF